MDTEQTIAEIEWLEHLRGARHETAERKRSRGCESSARREESQQPVVSALAPVWRLLPSRVPSNPARGIGELTSAGSNITATRDCGSAGRRRVGETYLCIQNPVFLQGDRNEKHNLY
jgi:hypothetical protein